MIYDVTDTYAELCYDLYKLDQFDLAENGEYKYM